tara:strand:+ start:231 stop:428 length:198 start_codon:yes stop_codon:yes gene_type:complete
MSIILIVLTASAAFRLFFRPLKRYKSHASASALQWVILYFWPFAVRDDLYKNYTTPVLAEMQRYP